MCDHRGTIFTTLVSWGNLILKYLQLLNELVFYVAQRAQPAMRTLEDENASLTERNSALEAKVAELEALFQLSAQTLVQYVPDAKPAKSNTSARSLLASADQAMAKVQVILRIIKAKRTVHAFLGLGGRSEDLSSVTVPFRSMQRVRSYGPRKRAAKTEAGQRSNDRYHRNVLQTYINRIIEAGASVPGKRERPPEDDRVRLSNWKAAVLLKGMDNSLKARDRMPA